MKNKPYTLLSLTIILWLSQFHAYAQDPRSSSQFYRDTFGVVDHQQYPLASRVSAVFSKLLRVADKAEYKDPELLLVNSDSWPWAIALPDNTVVLSRGAIEVCYRDVSKDQGDARLAMIVGHELGHLAEDDYWHRDVYLSLSNRPEVGASNVLRFIGERSGLVNANSEQWKTIVRDRELRADDRGFIYAALAGFETSLLSMEKNQSFFHYWTSETSKAAGDFHLTASDRATYLSARMVTLRETAELFHLGVSMVHLGEMDNAETIFRKVLTSFPAHEVYNNLGYIRLQQGLEYVSLDLQDLFWLPATLDTSPQSDALVTRNIEGAMDQDQLLELLEDAVQYFKLAIKQNPSYLTAYLNLSTAYFYQQKFNGAAATLVEAQAIAPGDSEVESLWHIAMLNSLKGNVDYLPIAIAKLEQLAKNDATRGILFNLAQLYELADRQDAATIIWNQLGQSNQSLAEPYGAAVMARLGKPISEDAPKTKSRGKLLPDFAKSTPTNQSQKQTATTISMDGISIIREVTSSSSLKYRFGNNKSIIINKLRASKIADNLLDCCGRPANIVPTGIGEVWIYNNGWAALLEQQMVREIWRIE